MKIAIISDIHGNLEALRATLKDIEKRKVDKIICLGDIIARVVHSKECIELVKANCDIILQGNCDLYFALEHTNMNEIPKLEQKRISQNNADVVIYGHIHQPYMDKLYNKTLINVGSIGISFDAIRNNSKDSDVMETTRSNYMIIEGEYGSRKYTTDISFQFIKVPYNIEKELEDEDLNIEKENYRYELKNGISSDKKRINDRFKKLGIDVEKI